jgi:pyruvate kinase
MFNKTKIIVTIGPASNSYEKLLAMVEGGVDVFRLNFSHGSYEEHEKIIKVIKQVDEDTDKHVGILADLQGPKLRIGELEEDIQLEEGMELVFTINEEPEEGQIFISYPQFPMDVKAGETFLVDDGNAEFEVVETDHEELVKVKVLNGNTLSSRKGVNLPNTTVSVPSLTEKDLRDLDFALKHNVSWIALSFVRSADDIHKLREIVDKKNVTKIIAKIEKSEAIEDIDAIIAASDAIMIARGDLGVEVPIHQMPILQKQIVQKCIFQSKPVIIATQIMDSMIRRPRPTRAEVNDIANSVYDGADALMLSGETSVGKYPLEAVVTMEKVLETIEGEHQIYNKELVPSEDSETFLHDAICFNACKLADEVDAKGIICMTRSGYTAFMVASYRPNADVYVFTDNEKLLTIMSLTWGVRAFYYDRFVSTDETIRDVKDILKKEGAVTSGDVVINLASMPLEDQGRTNMLKVSQID